MGGGGAADERDNRRQEMVSLPFPDEILVEIFLLLPTTADLVRASAACVSFRRVTADRAFLGLLRKLHAPPLLGFFDEDRKFHPAVPPHPFPPAASAADFSFSFLPAGAHCWVVQDSRDGRVLLKRRRQRGGFDLRSAFTVCDPLHRRYLQLPPIPDDLAASVEDPFPVISQPFPETFLVPPAEDKEEALALEEETSFRVICMVQCKFKLFAFVFSSSTGQWGAVPSQSWSDLSAGFLSPIRSRPLYSRQYADGCFYWMTDSMEKIMLVLNIRRMEFSIAELPPEAKYSNTSDVAMVEAGEGRLGMFVREHKTLSYTIRWSNGGSSSQWKTEKTISLDFQCLLGGSVGRYLLLYWWGNSWLGPCHFTLDIKTFQLEKVCDSSNTNLYTYINFPPLLSSPTISSGSRLGNQYEATDPGQ